MPVPRLSGCIPAGGIGAVLLLSACGPSKPVAPPLVLAPPTDTLQAPFSDAAGAVWLSVGRWAVVSEGSGTVGIVDFGAHRVTPLGGPKTPELRNPFVVFRSGDSLWVADWGLHRLTAWDLNGRFVGKVPAIDATRGALARMRDAQGRFYAPMLPVPGPDGSGNRDSGAVVRVSSGQDRIDTV